MLLGIITFCIDVYSNEPVIFDNTRTSVGIIYELFNDYSTTVTLYCIIYDYITFLDSLILHTGAFTFSCLSLSVFTKLFVMKLL